MVLTKIGELDLAWMAAQQGLAAAEQSEDPAILGSLKRSVVHTLQSHGRTEASVQLAERSADELRSELGRSDQRAVSVYGTFLLASSMAAARGGDSAGSKELLDEAGRYAGQLGRDANDLWTAFGPTNVRVHRVAAAVAQDNIAGAERYVNEIDPSGLPSERQVRYLFDTAVIAIRRDNIDDAISRILDAERLAPDQVHHHVMGQQIVGHLRNTKQGRQDPRLAQLDRRTRKRRARSGA